MFSVESRDRVRDRVLRLAASDARVIAGAIVGSLARDGGDRWSDLDLTFAVTDTLPLQGVLADCSTRRTRLTFPVAQVSTECSCSPSASSSIPR